MSQPIIAGIRPIATPTSEEPTVSFIHQLAREGFSKLEHHSPMTSMSVSRNELPHWDDLQIMVAQMGTKPLMEDHANNNISILGNFHFQ